MKFMVSVQAQSNFWMVGIDTGTKNYSISAGSAYGERFKRPTVLLFSISGVVILNDESMKGGEKNGGVSATLYKSRRAY